jgi:hypothetical protein
MYELKEEEAHPKTRWKWPHFLSGFVLLICGVLIGRALFPIEITKTLVVEKEKRVEVPVDRVVEKPMPYEVIKYVDRVVEKRVEVPIEKIVEKRIEVPVVRRVEVPVERIVFKQAIPPVETEGSTTSYPAWRELSFGMSRNAVRRILGEPRQREGDGDVVIESWYYGTDFKYGARASVRFGSSGLIGWDAP